ncbi:hypothetical protein ABPG74_009535 [Tetrahymena malaccensis]
MRLQKKKQELEEKGFIFDLYHYLWQDEDPQQNKHIVPSVNIPDTIYYKYGEPRLWFFTDKNGQVKKKMKNKLTIEKIEEEFLDKAPDCNIVAFFVWTSQNGQNYRFEYFNPEDFVKFLYSKSYEKEGYLQRFIQSKGTHNSIIKTIWSPKVCFHEKYQNQQPINDTTLDIYQRVINIETTKNQCEITQLKGRCLPIKINELSEQIALHLERVSTQKKKIRQMELIYKLDQHDKLYLLFCQNIISERAIELQQEQNQEYSYSIPNYINTDKIQLPRPLNLLKSNQCLNCEKLLDEESVYQIDLDTIIQAWDFDHIAEDQYLAEYEIDKNEKLIKKQKEAKQLNPLEKRKDATFNFYSITKNYQVPNVLRRVFPNLEYQDLLDNRSSAVFQVQKITVCEECYLKVMDSAHYGQNLKNLAKYIIKSSVHKTDDLVPLKNDRIFFHKFKTQALNEEKQLKNKSMEKFKSEKSLNKNFLVPDSYKDSSKSNMNRSNSSSKIFSSSFISKQQNESSLKQISEMYLKFPFLETNKSLKPLKLPYNVGLLNTSKKEANSQDILNQNQNSNLQGKQSESNIDRDYTQSQISVKQDQNNTVGDEVTIKSPTVQSPKINLRSIDSETKDSITLRGKISQISNRSNKILNYNISQRQYLKLAKLYPNEIKDMNVIPNSFSRYKSESNSKHHKSNSFSQIQNSITSKNAEQKLPQISEDNKQQLGEKNLQINQKS